MARNKQLPATVPAPTPKGTAAPTAPEAPPVPTAAEKRATAAPATGGYNGRARPPLNPSVHDDAAPALASAITRREHEWLVPGFVPAHTLTLMVGDPECGKSTWLAALAAAVSAGRHMYGRGGLPPHRVLIYAAEEGADTDVVPRLVAAAADLGRIRLGDVNNSGVQLPRLMLPADTAKLAQRLKDFGVSLCIIDPITSYIAGLDYTRDDQGVRGLLEGLKAVAESTACTIVCTKHYRKSREGDPLAWIGGAASWGQVPRWVLAVGRDPDQPESRILSVAKCSIGRKAPSQRFHIEGHEGSYRWVGDGECGLTAEDIGLGSGSPADRDALADAEAYLLAELGTEERPAKDIVRNAEEAGISRATLRRAKAKLGIVSVPLGSGPARVWQWRIPPQPGPADPPAGP